MKLPDSIGYLKWADALGHCGQEFVTDFSGYKEVKVRKADSSMIDARPNSCIDNSIDFAKQYDLEVVQGFLCIDKETPKYAFFHYWNRDPDTNTYWDISPVGNNNRYFVKDNTTESHG